MASATRITTWENPYLTKRNIRVGVSSLLLFCASAHGLKDLRFDS